jgi:hypothetical protein
MVCVGPGRGVFDRQIDTVSSGNANERGTADHHLLNGIDGVVHRLQFEYHQFVGQAALVDHIDFAVGVVQPDGTQRFLDVLHGMMFPFLSNKKINRFEPIDIHQTAIGDLQFRDHGQGQKRQCHKRVWQGSPQVPGRPRQPR